MQIASTYGIIPELVDIRCAKCNHKIAPGDDFHCAACVNCFCQKHIKFCSHCKQGYCKEHFRSSLFNRKKCIYCRLSKL